MIDFFRNIAITNDGTSTVFLPEWNEYYHSKHGALQESEHVFIKNGLDFCNQHKNNTPIHILEMGFGTGLNCLLSFQYALKQHIRINYVALEAYPILQAEIKQLNFTQILKAHHLQAVFEHMHEISWNKTHPIHTNFKLTKLATLFEHFSQSKAYDLIYFDVFGLRVQPELWTLAMFEKMYNALKIGGILVTYAANGPGRRAMMETGFQVEKLKGPVGKREMIRALKN